MVHRKGSPDNPMSADEVETKYRALAGSVLSETDTARVRELVFGLDTAGEVESLITAISGR